MPCCAVGCRNRPSRKSALHFYRIPSSHTPFHARRRRLWLQAIKRMDWTDKIITNARVCSAHFISGQASMDEESPDFVPSLFTYSRQSRVEALNKIDRFNRQRKREATSKSLMAISSLTAAQGASSVDPPAESQPESSDHPPVQQTDAATRMNIDTSEVADVHNPVTTDHVYAALASYGTNSGVMLDSSTPIKQPRCGASAEPSFRTDITDGVINCKRSRSQQPPREEGKGRERQSHDAMTRQLRIQQQTIKKLWRKLGHLSSTIVELKAKDMITADCVRILLALLQLPDTSEEEEEDDDDDQYSEVEVGDVKGQFSV